MKAELPAVPNKNANLTIDLMGYKTILVIDFTHFPVLKAQAANPQFLYPIVLHSSTLLGMQKGPHLC